MTNGPASSFQRLSAKTEAMTNSISSEDSHEDFAELVHNLNEMRDLWINVGLALRDFQFEKTSVPAVLFSSSLKC
ncbi:MAG: hypothetical protein IPF71_15045 [Rhodoferax sp.]|nr:hypothetical protein [Rhodoferax sp.]